MAQREAPGRARDSAGRPRMGRPAKQPRANRAVARALALAGRDVVGRAYGTRGLADELEMSQTLISRACRSLEGDPVRGREVFPEAVPLARFGAAIDEIRVEEARLTVIFRVESLAFGEGADSFSVGADLGEQGIEDAVAGLAAEPGGVAGDSVGFAADSADGAADSADGVLRPAWVNGQERRRGWAFLAALRQWDDREEFCTRVVVPDEVRASRASGEGVRKARCLPLLRSEYAARFDDFEAFAGAVAHLLVHVRGEHGLRGVPFDLLEFLADAVAADVNAFFWRRAVEDANIAAAFDSLSGDSGHRGLVGRDDEDDVLKPRPMEARGFHPWREVGDTVWRRTLVAELEADIHDHDLHAGDEVSVRRLATRMGVAQREIVRGLSELHLGGVLERAGNVFRLPVVSGESVLDLYAARFSVGVVVLRGAAAGRSARGRSGVGRSRVGRSVLGSSAVRAGMAAHTGAASTGAALVGKASVGEVGAGAARAGGSLYKAGRALSRLEEDDSLGPRSVDRLDLQFQQGLAEASGLDHTADIFESLEQRLRLLIAILRVDYGSAAGKILSDNLAIYDAVRRGRAEDAIAVWRSKIENAVRHMSGVAGLRRFDVEAWRTLVG